MGNPTNDGEYDDSDYKHDCPRPMTGCRYPKCSCDVDENTLSHKEKQAIDAIAESMEERDYGDQYINQYFNG